MGSDGRQPIAYGDLSDLEDMVAWSEFGDRLVNELEQVSAKEGLPFRGNGDILALVFLFEWPGVLVVQAKSFFGLRVLGVFSQRHRLEFTSSTTL